MYFFFVWLVGLVMVGLFGLFMGGCLWWMSVMKMDSPLDCAVFFSIHYVIGTYIIGAMHLMNWLLS